MSDEKLNDENAELYVSQTLNDLLYTEKEYPLFSMVGEGAEVIRIENDGRTFWRNREIETDDDF